MFFGVAVGDLDLFTEGYAPKYEFGKRDKNCQCEYWQAKNTAPQYFKQTRQCPDKFGKHGA